MRFAAGPPTLWLVTLLDGAIVHVYADSFKEPTAEDDRYVFGSLVDASREEQWELDVLARTPTNSERVEICVARIPAASVASVFSGMAGDR